MESDLIWNISDSYFLSEDESDTDKLKIDLQYESFEELIDYFNFVQIKEEKKKEVEEDKSSSSPSSDPIFINTNNNNTLQRWKQRRRADRLVLTQSQRELILLPSEKDSDSNKEFLTSDNSNNSFASARSTFGNLFDEDDHGFGSSRDSGSTSENNSVCPEFPRETMMTSGYLADDSDEIRSQGNVYSQPRTLSTFTPSRQEDNSPAVQIIQRGVASMKILTKKSGLPPISSKKNEMLLTESRSDESELEEGEIRSTSEDNSNELSDAPNNLNNRFDPSRFRECNDSPQHLVRVMCSNSQRPDILRQINCADSSNPVNRRVSMLLPLAEERQKDAEYLRSLEDLTVSCRNRNNIALRCFSLFNKYIFGDRLPGGMQVYWSTKINLSIGMWSEADGAISLSPRLLLKAELLRDSLLHEMCHAAVSLIDKVPLTRGKQGHFNTWISHAKSMFPDVKLLAHCLEDDLEYVWHYICQRCNITYKRHRNTIDIMKKSCVCGGPLQVYRNGGPMSCRYVHERHNTTKSKVYCRLTPTSY